MNYHITADVLNLKVSPIQKNHTEINKGNPNGMVGINTQLKSKCTHKFT